MLFRTVFAFAVATTAFAVVPGSGIAHADHTMPLSPSGCYPLSNKGTCYEPGERCRNSDHGASGVAGDGKSMVCEREQRRLALGASLKTAPETS